MASFGERTCEVCGGLDGQRFKLTDIQYGVNFPPVHPNCRCTTVGWDEADEEPLQLEGQQQIDYEEWKKLYVDDRAEIEIPIQPEPPVPVIPAAQYADNQRLTTGGDSGIMRLKKVYSFEEYADNPILLAECSPSEMYSLFSKSEYLVLPLGNGSLKGVSFENGGGFRVFFDDSMQKMLMYHPENRSHHKGAYYKLSEGKFGIHRYNLDGTEKKE